MDKIHITDIKVGDTILHNGELKTVCANNIGRDPFMGVSLFGDSYRSGRILVDRIQPSEINNFLN